MVLRRSYKITEGVLEELAAQGLSAHKLQALAQLEGRSFLTQGELLNAMGTKAKPDKAESKLIVKLTRPSLLRLEKIIPHRGAREWAEALFFAFAVAAVVRTFIFAPFEIPTGSMVPTILEGDRIFASMFNYGIPVPFTDVKLFRQPIERGDIIIFPYPLDPSQDYIKRVIAVGGDTLEIRGQKVILNGVEQDEPHAFFDPIIQTQLDKVGESQRLGPIVVPKGKLFMMGDNRYNSADSRVWGFVDEITVKGQGGLIYWSHDPMEGLGSGYRFNRIGSFLK